MRNKGVSMNSLVSVSYAKIQDIITVTIHCRDNRKGGVDTEKAMTFTDSSHGFFPDHGGPQYSLEFLRAWNKIEGWLQHMGLDNCCHAYVIDTILKCSDYQLPPGCCGSLSLEVHLEIDDAYSYVSKQPRLHRRDDDVEEGMGFGGDGLKRVCTSH